MDDTPELYEIDVAEWKRETPKAWLVLTTCGTEHWLPKAQIVERHDDSVLIPMWLADRAKIALHIERASAA